MDIRVQSGIWWPRGDREAHPVLPEQLPDLEQVIALCAKTDLAVQAGGNVGLWPKRLAQSFVTVLTFEPEPVNFFCLNQNLQEPNIVKLQAALGHKPGLAGMDLKPENVGAHQMNAAGGIGNYPVLALDSFNLPACDLIYLDIEGMETGALLGATDTIAFHKPVIAFENKGLGSRYGYGDGDAVDLLYGMGYELKLQLHRDLVMVPK